jgi:transmembrane sensor
MNSPQRHDTAIDEQAAYWAARLDGDVLEASERADLDAWLAHSPAHRTALSAYCQFSADLEEQLPKLVASGAVKMPPKAAVHRTWKFPIVFGTALAAAATVAVVVWFARPAPEIQNVASGLAERSSHTLPDGTRVELNAHTSLRFESTGSERLARLTGGEAIFFVSKNPARPFVVQTPTGAVRVTGTVFNVRDEPTEGAFEVTVVEGSVEVRPRDVAGGPIALKANDRLMVKANQAEQRVVSEAELEAILAWRDGQIVFDEVPLAEAVARFARYHGRSITIPPALASEPIGGRHSIDDLPGFLSFIETSYGVKASEDSSRAITLR